MSTHAQATSVRTEIVVALALRYVLRGGGPGLVAEHWPGPRESLALILRLAFRTR